MTDVILPDTLEEIGIQTFMGCKSPKKMTIPDSVKLIAYEAFKECKGMKEFHSGNG